MKSIKDVFPRYSVAFLSLFYDEYHQSISEYLGRTRRGEYRLEGMFEHDPLPAFSRSDDVVCASLFFKPSIFPNLGKNPLLDEWGQIPESELHRVGHPSFGDGRRSGSTFHATFVEPLLKADFSGFRPVLFLASDLACLKEELKAVGIEVVMMHHASVGHSPGAMWRYLSFNFPARSAYILDTDRPFDGARARALLDLLDADPATTLARRLQHTGNGGSMALILGNDFAVANESVDFCVKKNMLGYIALNIALENRAANFVFEPRHERVDGRSRCDDADYTGPRPGERVPRKCFPFYGFDEEWLKDVIYYHFSNGRMGTLVGNYNRDDVLQSLDLKYQLENGNLVWKKGQPA